ncbi:MAG TPA: gephyrin-like molybdotransferase Glp [Candidatus Acidoferrales bacterium]|nr:gephyrin-like molybdotransferase Glp [Candidatus Acidoferrales bacterium]
MLSFEDARAKVIETLAARAGSSGKQAFETETIDLGREPSAALGRILAEDLLADRNYPPFNRSIRDGFALRSADVDKPGARLRLIGESRAGVAFNGNVGKGECVRILTGAPVPHGANAVVMHEFTHSEGDFVVFDQAAHSGQHFVLAGAEARVGEVVVRRGTRLSYAELAMAAEVGRARVEVSRRPRVAILSTGDELVSVDRAPGPFQIRNSNNISLAAQVTLAGGEPILAGNAKDEAAELRARIEQGLDADILVLSGGVSAGKYDLVEQVLQDLGAEFFFDAVAIRPGRPAVFGWCRGKPVFGLPGNPVSTMVTFELFVVPAIEALSAYAPKPLPFVKAKLAHPVDEKGTVAHFLPARVSWPAGETGGDPKVEVVLWEGSGDIGAVVRGNCFLVVHASRLQLEAGEWVDVLLRRGLF